MTQRPPRLLVHTSPFIRQGATTPGIMRDVLVALVPVLAIATWIFGLSALLMVAAASAGAVATERWLGRRGPGPTSLADNSALLTGVLLGLVLPPGLPLWMAFLGGVVGVGLGKVAWGGLGNNLFNPALVGRAFLQAAFPTALTTWPLPGDLMGSGLPGLRASNFAIPFLQGEVDGLTGATPLNLMQFAHQGTPWQDLLRGNVAGSLGETSAVVILLAGVWLALRRAFDWRIPVSILSTVAVFSGVLYAIDPERYPSPLFMLLSGGLLFGAVFMATDPVSSPLAPRGAWIFGVGIGVLVVLIRVWAGLPEGVMYAILLMNAATPLIEKIERPRAYGHAAKGRA
ncbi:MAG: RnfABCDGE type electron transport complex subunit D [bacterium]|nr:RnfABCDGE type electron transport complex subunit D [bacterium]